MAIDTTTLTPSQIPFWYSGIPAITRQSSPVPIGEIRLAALGQTIPNPGAGDNQRLEVAASLPANYTYVLTDVMLRILRNTAGTNQWGQSVECLWRNAASGQTTESAIELFNRNVIQVGGTNVPERIYTADKLPSYVTPPASMGDQVSMFLDVVNQTANDGAYTVHFFARVLCFSMLQASNYGANAPLYIR